jgi:hypothetical protein
MASAWPGPAATRRDSDALVLSCTPMRPPPSAASSGVNGSRAVSPPRRRTVRSRRRSGLLLRAARGGARARQAASQRARQAQDHNGHPACSPAPLRPCPGCVGCGRLQHAQGTGCHSSSHTSCPACARGGPSVQLLAGGQRHALERSTTGCASAWAWPRLGPAPRTGLWARAHGHTTYCTDHAPVRAALPHRQPMAGRAGPGLPTLAHGLSSKRVPTRPRQSPKQGPGAARPRPVHSPWLVVRARAAGPQPAACRARALACRGPLPTPAVPSNSSNPPSCGRRVHPTLAMPAGAGSRPQAGPQARART